MATHIPKIGAIAGSLLLLGLVVCPKSPGRGEVDAHQLMLEVKAAQASKYSTIELPKDTDPFIPLVEGKDRLAGRDAWVLRLKPKVKHTPWSQYWIDVNTKAIIAYKSWDAQDNLIRHRRF